MTTLSHNDPDEEAKINELHLYVGQAMSGWANIEYQLASLFAWSVDLPISKALLLLQHANTFSAMLKMTNTMFLKKSEDQHQQRYWKDLVEYLRELSGDRNYFAHVQMVVHVRASDDNPEQSIAEPTIGPSMTVMLAGTGRSDPITRQEANEIVQDFIHANMILVGFLNATERGGPYPEIWQQPVQRRRPPRNERQDTNRRARQRQP